MTVVDSCKAKQFHDHGPETASFVNDDLAQHHSNEAYERVSNINMCQIITARLSCGHSVARYNVQCRRAARRLSTSRQTVSGSGQFCESRELLELNLNTCCEHCFSEIFRGFMDVLCRPCRSMVRDRAGQQLIQELQHPRSASFSRRGGDIATRPAERIGGQGFMAATPYHWRG